MFRIDVSQSKTNSMCLIVFSYKKSSDYPFIFAANRDEFYDRPTSSAHVWDTTPKILAGKDEKEGGTWLGISENGRFAALTNYRQMNEIKEDTISRGMIVKDFLLSDINPRKYLFELIQNQDEYNGFNLIAGYLDDLYYISNKKKGVYKIKPGLHSVSNALLNTSWPKTEEAVEAFEKYVERNSPSEEEIFKILQSKKTYPLDELPDTGLPKEMEKAVSSIFISTHDYGTRSSTVMMLDKNNYMRFTERSYKRGSTEVEKTVRFNFKL